MKQWPDAPREGGDSTWRVVLLGALAIVGILLWSGDAGFRVDLPNVDLQRQFAALEREVGSIFASEPESISQQAPQEVSASEDWQNPLFANQNAQMPTRLDAVPYGQCVKLIEQTAGAMGGDVTVLEEGSERRVVAIRTGEDDLVLTCMDGTMTMEQRAAQ